MYKDECKWKEKKKKNLKETIEDQKRSNETIKNVYEEKLRKGWKSSNKTRKGILKK